MTLSSAGGIFTYSRPNLKITLQTPDIRDPFNWKLHATSIWASSVFLADHLDELGIESRHDRLRVLEFGASAGLPGIVLSKLYGPKKVLVTVSDYPDEVLMKTLSENVDRNDCGDNCTAVSYAWGTDPSKLLQEGPYDMVIAADVLWNIEFHDVLIQSLSRTVKRDNSSRIHLVAGLHTGRYILKSFMKIAVAAGFRILNVSERAKQGDERREWAVDRAEAEDETEKRKWLVWIILGVLTY